MSVLCQTETQNNCYKTEKYSNQNNDLWLEINLNQKDQSVSTQEDLSINNNTQLLPIHEAKSILDSKFYLIKKIGQGSSGKVYLGCPKETFHEPYENIKYYSIKIMDREKIDLDVFKNEINLLEKINHKNVLKIFAYGYGPKISLSNTKNKKPKEFYYIVMEYLEHGELYKYITDVEDNDNIGFGENFGRILFSQLLDGLEAMHNLNISHRDIKLQNILIGENDYLLKYIDLGMGIEGQTRLETFLGTPSYAAPELHLKIPYYGKSEDIFSLGVTLFVLVTGRLPFKLAVPNDRLYQYIARNDYIEFWKNQLLDVSPSFMELFDNMVAFDYSQRPSISEIRQSAWMKEINWELLPLLKQEFILRENKIKINEEKKRQISMNNIKCMSILKPDNFIFNDSNTINSSVKVSIINENNEEINNTNIYKNQKKLKNKEEEMIKIKSRCKNLNQQISNIRKFLKREGYIKFGGNIKKYELEVTNGEIDIHLRLEKYKDGYIKLKYYKIRGSSESYERFKIAIVNIRAIIDI